MSKEELIQFLKENLTISIDEEGDYYSKWVKFTVKLENETISEDSFFFPDNSCSCSNRY